MCILLLQYNCVDAPLKFNGITYSWWNDKNGNQQFFWSGSNTSVHICQCGIEGDCFDSRNGITCNCDSVLKTKPIDDGKRENLNFILKCMRTPINIALQQQFTCQRRNYNGQKSFAYNPSKFWQNYFE